MNAEAALDYVLKWIDAVDGAPVRTLARFAISLDELPIWPVWGDDETDLDIYVDDILAFLTVNWDALLLEQVYPQGLNPDRPSKVRAAAEWQVARGPRNTYSDDLLASTITFARSHDFARCFGGLYELPAFWMMRQGEDMLLETADRIERVPLADWVRFASDLGDRIAARLEPDAEKWGALVAAWRTRDTADPVRIAALAIGQTAEVASQLMSEELIPHTDSVREAANDNDGLRIAARMVGGIPYHAIRAILIAAKSVPHRPSSDLDALREELEAEMAMLSESAYPYEQGVHAANWLRQRCNLSSEGRADPIATLRRYDVHLLQEHIGPSVLDALAIWGSAHGPAVIFNLASRRLTRNGGGISSRALKIIAAHELCHMVLDFRRTLAAVDILDSRMPVIAEQRANAFAAEFMLPAQTAVGLWRLSALPQTRDGLSSFLDRLSDRFDVSRVVAGWQLDHGLAGSNAEIVFLLDDLLDRR